MSESSTGPSDLDTTAEVRRPPKRRSSPTVPIFTAIVVAAIMASIVLQWQCRRRCAMKGGDEEKDSTAAMKENGAVKLASSEGRCSVDMEEGEVFMAVDDGFGM
jgi:hypothetical protein